MSGTRNPAYSSWRTSCGGARSTSSRGIRWSNGASWPRCSPALAFVDAFANSAVVDTDDGLVVVDTSGVFHAGTRARDDPHVVGRPARHRDLHARPHRPRVRRRPLRGGGAHERLGGAARRRARGDRRALRSLPAHRRLQRGDQPAAVQAPGLRWPTEYRYPDETYTDTLDDRRRRRDVRAVPRPRRDRRRTRGCGRRRAVLFAGDMFIWASPNCGNPQKVQRYARDWAVAFRKMDALEPEVLLPGHGLPIVGAERVQQALHRGCRAARVARRADARADERRRAPRRHRAHRARAGAPARTPVPARRSTTSPSSSCATSGGSTAAGTTATRRTSSRRPTAALAARARRRSPAAPARLADAGARSSRPRATCGSPVTSPSSPRRPRPTTRACTRPAPRCSARAAADEASTMSKGIFAWAEHESAARELGGIAWAREWTEQRGWGLPRTPIGVYVADQRVGPHHLNVGWFDDVDDTLDVGRRGARYPLVVRRRDRVLRVAHARGGAVPQGAGKTTSTPRSAKPIVLDARTHGLGDLWGLRRPTAFGTGCAEARWRFASGDFGKVVSVRGFLNIRRPRMVLPQGRAGARREVQGQARLRHARRRRRAPSGAPRRVRRGPRARFAAAMSARDRARRRAAPRVSSTPRWRRSRSAGSDDTVRRVPRVSSELPVRAEDTAGKSRRARDNHKGKKNCRPGRDH